MTDQAPTPEDVQKGQQVAQAGMEAASEAPPEQRVDAAKQGMKKERDRIGFDQLPDAEIDRIAERLRPMLTVGVIEGFREQGAFDAPPEPVQAPPPNAAPPPPGEPAAAAAAPGQGEPAPAPTRRTFASRFMGE